VAHHDDDQSVVLYANRPPEARKQEVRLENPTQTSTQREQGPKDRHTRPWKQVPSLQPRPSRPILCILDIMDFIGTASGPAVNLSGW